MPHVISLQCSNPECEAHLDSEEIHIWYGDIYHGLLLMEGLEREAKLDGWEKDGSEWHCKDCRLIEGEWKRFSEEEARFYMDLRTS